MQFSDKNHHIKTLQSTNNMKARRIPDTKHKSTSTKHISDNRQNTMPLRVNNMKARRRLGPKAVLEVGPSHRPDSRQPECPPQTLAAGKKRQHRSTRKFLFIEFVRFFLRTVILGLYGVLKGPICNTYSFLTDPVYDLFAYLRHINWTINWGEIVQPYRLYLSQDYVLWLLWRVYMCLPTRRDVDRWKELYFDMHNRIHTYHAKVDFLRLVMSPDASFSHIVDVLYDANFFSLSFAELVQDLSLSLLIRYVCIQIPIVRDIGLQLYELIHFEQIMSCLGVYFEFHHNLDLLEAQRRNPVDDFWVVLNDMAEAAVLAD